MIFHYDGFGKSSLSKRFIRIRRATIEARHFSYQLDFSDEAEN
ncbi:hypothetical protein LEP1GSC133_4399 [Leptospira borgpetersenii serovar Pomona str. 200901868]|uniref:Uncharacterized protein n=1 Tax=Leptospira borgpetersenii serovar Pomona str. 200901868 TaxID=1192866 RepID=M6W5K0_LEPBO|nr:hypothetical protein LEP1GSC133_4399 [Leptospira borgpetersenii serovar Pomona str. 200901868]